MSPCFSLQVFDSRHRITSSFLFTWDLQSIPFGFSLLFFLCVFLNRPFCDTLIIVSSFGACHPVTFTCSYLRGLFAALRTSTPEQLLYSLVILATAIVIVSLWLALHILFRDWYACFPPSVYWISLTGCSPQISRISHLRLPLRSSNLDFAGSSQRTSLHRQHNFLIIGK